MSESEFTEFKNFQNKNQSLLKNHSVNSLILQILIQTKNDGSMR